MRPFRFSLETARRLRRQRVEALEAELAALTARQAEARQRAAEFGRRAAQARETVREDVPLDGAALRAAENAAAGWAAGASDVRRCAEALDPEIRRLRDALARAQRQWRALDELRARRLREWTAEFDRAEETAAAEAYLARFARRDPEE